MDLQSQIRTLAGPAGPGADDRKLARAQRKQKKPSAMPREIHVRHITRDGMVTCLKMTVFMRIEWVVEEYFGGLRIEPRTVTELFVATAVTVRERPREVVYELEANPRSPKNTERLRAACAEITRRELRVQDKLWRFAVVESTGGS